MENIPGYQSFLAGTPNTVPVKVWDLCGAERMRGESKEGPAGESPAEDRSSRFCSMEGAYLQGSDSSAIRC